MTEPGRVVPHGAWPSPLSPTTAAAGAPRFGDLALSHTADGRTFVWWTVLVDGVNAVFRSEGGAPPEQVSTVRSARSRVNEYGGGAMWVHGSVVFWVEDADQRIRCLDTVAGWDATELSPEPPSPTAWRYAAGTVDPTGSWMVVERELHAAPNGSPLPEAVNDLAWLPCRPAGRPAPDGAPSPAMPVTLVRGPDFCAAPTLSPDGRSLAWLQWDHPDMPWDAAELWVGDMVVDLEGAQARVSEPRRLAGGRPDRATDELGRPVSVCLPQWGPDGSLWFCDDREDRWNLRSVDGASLVEAAGETAATRWDGPGDVGEPRWVSGGSRFGFLDDGSVVLAETVYGLDEVKRVRPGVPGGRPHAEPVGPDGITWVDKLVAGGEHVAMVVGRADVPTSVMVIGPQATSEPVAGSWLLDQASVSRPIPISFPTGNTGADSDPQDATVAHGLLYRPCLDGVQGPEGERPPLVVRIHGGPTAHARAELSSSVQFWTTRGFAVVEVNHRGSTGFGRHYRDELLGGWGVVDVQDCIAAAEHLAAVGEVDGERCVIRGGSAGGFTALESLCAPTTAEGFSFAGATTLYGVTDLAALVDDGHKFESRYLDGLVGPLPQAAAVYAERSPLNHVERITVPVLVLQGLDDTVVPPSQAEKLVTALVAAGVDHEYRTYAGEGHGFRRSATVVDALAAELAFYGRILGFSPDDADA